jgi:hypothetical protein
MLLSRRVLHRGVVPLLLAALAGCADDGPKVVKVNGSLTYKGKPVPGAMLTFQPEFGRQSWAQTDAQGKFKVNYDRHQDGAVVGKHKVWVTYEPSSTAEQEAYMSGKPAPLSKEMQEFFKKYSADNSKVEVQIDRNTGEIKLELD